MGLFDTFKVSDMSVVLHNPAVYPGTCVSGTLSFKATSPVSMRAVRIKLSGRERTHIQVSHGSGKHRRTSHYHGTTIIVKHLFTVAGDCKVQPSGSNGELPAGDYVIPFEFFLPIGVPPSGAARMGPQYAVIEYHIKGYVDIPYGRDAAAKTPLRVLTTMPVGQYAARGTGGMVSPLTVPITCCCCISKGSLVVRAQADRSIVALDRDDSIGVTITVDNALATEPLGAIVVSLQNRTTFSAGAYSRTATTTVATMRTVVDVPAGALERSVNAILPIPAQVGGGALASELLPSMVGKLLRSQWVVAVEMEIAYASDPVVTFPIAVVPRVDETNQAPALQWESLAYATMEKGQICEYVYVAPPRLRDVARGLLLLPAVTGHAQPPYFMQHASGQQLYEAQPMHPVVGSICEAHPMQPVADSIY